MYEQYYLPSVCSHTFTKAKERLDSFYTPRSAHTYDTVLPGNTVVAKSLIRTVSYNNK